MTRRRWRDILLPRSLFGRMTLILFLGLSAAHLFSFGLVFYERMQVARTTMLANFAKDVATSVAILERVPAAVRAEWIDRLTRRNYRYSLGAGPDGMPARSATARSAEEALANELGPAYPVSVTAPPDAENPLQLRVRLRLSDATPLTIDLFPPGMVISIWVPLVLAMQLALLVAFTWVAVRVTTRPLSQLAAAADSLGPDIGGETLPEDGPTEVARAAVAFNAMRRRIADYLAERIQILAAISHDLQTPITRMRLRTDLLEDAALTEKLRADLDAMQVLVREGIAYARSTQGVSETSRATDLHALLDSLVCDYIDAGRSVRIVGRYDRPFVTRPHALRRIITNLTDNALKFATDVEIFAESKPPGRVSIIVRDRGPGIHPHELKAVFQPFHRVENSRNRETGGTGLGLAIAQQLTMALAGDLTLSNREDGGLEARLSLPDTSGPRG
jgi:signal transduction histidine kinase